MKDFISYLYLLFSQYGYGAVFAGIMLDIVGVPLAGELTLLLAGSLVATGSLGWGFTVLVASVAALLSDGVWYVIGRLGAVHLVRVYCRLSFGSAACLTLTEEMLLRFGPRSLMISRFVPGFRTFAAPISGISRLEVSRFLLFDGIGALLWAAAGVILGMLFVNQINHIVDHAAEAHSAMLVLAGVLLAVFMGMKLWVRVRHGKANIRMVAVSKDELT